VKAKKMNEIKCPECRKLGIETDMTEYLSHYHCPRCGFEILTFDGGVHRKSIDSEQYR